MPKDPLSSLTTTRSERRQRALSILAPFPYVSYGNERKGKEVNLKPPKPSDLGLSHLEVVDSLKKVVEPLAQFPTMEQLGADGLVAEQEQDVQTKELLSKQLTNMLYERIERDNRWSKGLFAPEIPTLLLGLEGEITRVGGGAATHHSWRGLRSRGRSRRGVRTSASSRSHSSKGRRASSGGIPGLDGEEEGGDSAIGISHVASAKYVTGRKRKLGRGMARGSYLSSSEVQLLRDTRVTKSNVVLNNTIGRTQEKIAEDIEDYMEQRDRLSTPQAYGGSSKGRAASASGSHSGSGNGSRIASPETKLMKSNSGRHHSASLDRSSLRSPFVKSGSFDATGTLGAVYSPIETAKQRLDDQYYRAINYEAEKRAEEKSIRQELQSDAQSDGFASRTMKEIVYSTVQVERTDSKDDQSPNVFYHYTELPPPEDSIKNIESKVGEASRKGSNSYSLPHDLRPEPFLFRHEVPFEITDDKLGKIIRYTTSIMYWGSVSPGDRGKKDKFRSPQFRFFKSQFKTYLTMTTNFEKDTNSQLAFKKYMLMPVTLSLARNIFWYCQVRFFQHDAKASQILLLDIIASDFFHLTNMFADDQNDRLRMHKDMFFDYIPFAMAEIIYQSFYFLIPGSRNLFTKDFKDILCYECCGLLAGGPLNPGSMKLIQERIFFRESHKKGSERVPATPSTMERQVQAFIATTSIGATRDSSPPGAEGLLSSRPQSPANDAKGINSELLNATRELARDQMRRESMKKLQAAAEAEAKAVAAGVFVKVGQTTLDRLLQAWPLLAKHLQSGGALARNQHAHQRKKRARQVSGKLFARHASILVHHQLSKQSADIAQKGNDQTLRRKDPIAHCRVGGLATYYKPPSRSNQRLAFLARCDVLQQTCEEDLHIIQEKTSKTLKDLEIERKRLREEGVAGISKYTLDLIKQRKEMRANMLKGEMKKEGRGAGSRARAMAAKAKLLSPGDYFAWDDEA